MGPPSYMHSVVDRNVAMLLLEESQFSNQFHGIYIYGPFIGIILIVKDIFMRQEILKVQIIIIFKGVMLWLLSRSEG